MNPVDGVLLIDKASGMTSHDVVARARRILGISAIGHAGTLDPLASGLMLLLIGEATKVSDYLLNGNKGYEVAVRLGVVTDSMDVTGQVLSEHAVDVSEALIRQSVAKLTGTLKLAVPAHSAVKVDGRKLYEFAHKGEVPPEIPMREMTFFDVETVGVVSATQPVGVVSATQPGAVGAVARVTVRLRCSKGSFVRAWANQLGAELGCGGTVESLRRDWSDPFDLLRAITLEELDRRWQAKSARHGSALGSAWVPLAESLPHFQTVSVAGHDEKLMRNGQIARSLEPLLLSQMQPTASALPPVCVLSRDTSDLVALLVAEPGQFYKIKRVFLSH